MTGDDRAAASAHPSGAVGSGADEHLRTLYEAVPCGIIVRDASGRIVFANAAAKRILRTDLDPAEGRLWMPSLARTREDGSDLPLSETPGAIAGRTGEPIRDFAMRVTRLDRTDCWLLVDAVPLKDDAGRVVQVVTSLTDISERKRLETELERRAVTDQLTRLPNRWLFLDRAEQSLRFAKRAGQGGPAVLFADLDRFKELNDRFGHAAGDATLREAAARFQASLRESDTVARIGGDEFGILLPMADGVEEATAVATKLEEALAAPWAFDGRAVRLGASIGIAVAPRDGSGLDALLAAADARMYAIKRKRVEARAARRR